jgi:hypothetical protein
MCTVEALARAPISVTCSSRNMEVGERLGVSNHDLEGIYKLYSQGTLRWYMQEEERRKSWYRGVIVWELSRMGLQVGFTDLDGLIYRGTQEVLLKGIG